MDQVSARDKDIMRPAPVFPVVDARLLEEVVARIRRAGNPRRVVLFGSHALYANPFERAAILAALGRRADAFRELERAYRDRFITITWLKVAPSLDPLRADSRYSDLLRRMRLE